MRKHLADCLILIRPLILSFFTLCSWEWIRRYELQFSKEDSEFIKEVLGFLGTFHAILASGVLVKVWKDYANGYVHLQNDNREEFMRSIQVRIPFIIHLLLGVMSLMIIGTLIQVRFATPRVGQYTTFLITLVLGLYWEVATNLDDPRKAWWYRHRIPREWWEDPEMCDQAVECLQQAIGSNEQTEDAPAENPPGS